MQNFIELIDFSFSFHKNSGMFFEKMSLFIKNKGLIFIVGKNGVGKSTLFRLLQGVVYPGEKVTGLLKIGNITYDLSDPFDQQRLYNRSIVLHQNFDLMLAAHFTGWQNLSFAQISHIPQLKSIDFIQENTIFEQKFNVPLSRPVYLLSGGQRQLLALMMLFRRNVDIILLDEPIAALDLQNAYLFMNALQEYCSVKNIAIFAIVHDENIIAQYATTLISVSRNDDGTRIISVQ